MNSKTMLALLILFLLWQRTQRGHVTARIYGADVAPGVDVEQGEIPYYDPEIEGGWIE